MPADPPRIYWDACVLLSYIEATPGRIEVLAELMHQADSGEIAIVTSTISRVEVAYGVDDEANAKIDELWTPASPITLVEVYDGVTIEAGSLVRQASKDGWKLTPCDAIHIASASKHASEMQTYDAKLPRYSNAAGIPIRKPITPQLPLTAQDTP